jgi:hypothetical protein
VLESITLGAEPLLAILPQNARKADSRSNLPNNGTFNPMHRDENVGRAHDVEPAHNAESIKRCKQILHFMQRSHCCMAADNQLAFFLRTI